MFWHFATNLCHAIDAIKAVPFEESEYDYLSIYLELKLSGSQSPGDK